MNDWIKKTSQIDCQSVIEKIAGVKFDAHGKACCPLPGHSEKTASFSIDKSRNKWKCFGCGRGGDCIDFVSEFRQIETVDAAKLIAEIFNIDTDKPCAKNVNLAKNTKITKEQNPKSVEPKISNVKKQEIKDYILECVANVSKTDYFAKRGLNAETISKYFLGYDTKRSVIVLPYSSRLSYYQTRSVEGKTFFKPKTEDAGAEPLYNGDALYKTREPIFVVESPLCALSVMQCGGVSVSLCGVNGANKLIKEVKCRKPTSTLILCLDNDEPGEKASVDLAAELFELGVKFDVYNIAGKAKDPNELLMLSSETLAQNILAAKIHAKKKYITKKDSISAAELQNSRLEPIEWVVEGVLPVGLALVCAPSKYGKSWMMMQLCLDVSSGAEFLNFKTTKHGCLYFALEDGYTRLQERLNKLLSGNKAPSNVRFIIQADSVDLGLFPQIKAELESNPDTKLVIIDTLQKVRGKSEKNENAYSSDYREMAKFKEFADENKICLLLVHHLRKMKDDDVFNQISGSNGIMGASDTILILNRKNRGDTETKLSMVGRDIRQDDLIITFDNTKYRWEVVGTAEEEEHRIAKNEYESNPVVKTIKELVGRSPYGWKGTITELMISACEILGSPIPESNEKIGRIITKYETQLGYDGIIHSKPSGKANGRVHVFARKQPKIYQTTMENNE